MPMGVDYFWLVWFPWSRGGSGPFLGSAAVAQTDGVKDPSQQNHKSIQLHLKASNSQLRAVEI